MLDFARVRGRREGANPAAWRGNLQHAPPAPGKAARGRHAALPYQEVAAFLERPRARPSTSALALEFTILTACRTNEVLGARFAEVDSASGLWAAPKERTETARVHEVPLRPRALEIVRFARTLTKGDLLFPGAIAGKALSNMAMLMLLDHLEEQPAASPTAPRRGRPRKGEERAPRSPAAKRRTITVHGFRSTFRTWASEETEHPDWVCEMALGHAIKSRVERAYRRGALLAKRRALMEDWEVHCAPPPAVAAQGQVEPLP